MSDWRHNSLHSRLRRQEQSEQWRTPKCTGGSGAADCGCRCHRCPLHGSTSFPVVIHKNGAIRWHILVQLILIQLVLPCLQHELGEWCIVQKNNCSDCLFASSKQTKNVHTPSVSVKPTIPDRSRVRAPRPSYGTFLKTFTLVRTQEAEAFCFPETCFCCSCLWYTHSVLSSATLWCSTDVIPWGRGGVQRCTIIGRIAASAEISFWKPFEKFISTWFHTRRRGRMKKKRGFLFHSYSICGEPG